MFDGVDHLGVIALLGAMKRGNTFADAHLLALVRPVLDQRGFAHVDGIVDALGVGLEHVQDEAAGRPEMLAELLEAGHLVAHLEQALKRTERNKDELELFAQVKPGHVALHEMDAFALFFVERGALARGVLEHAFGKVERSEEHTSELQSRLHLVCRLLLEKKKTTIHHILIANTILHNPDAITSSPTGIILTPTHIP